MTGISTRVAIKQDLYIGPDVWVPPVVGASVYPLLVHGFVSSVQAYQGAAPGTPKIMLALCALLLMGAELAVPGAALRGLISIRDRAEPNVSLIRRVLLLVVATPPLQTLMGFAAAGWGVPETWAWYSLWGFLAMFVFLVRTGASSRPAVTVRTSTRLRTLHGISALLLLTGFLALHLGNHLAALWTVQAHHELMDFLRGWYRSAWVQPCILGLFGTMIVTGTLLVIRHTASSGDVFRTLQMATGAYLVAFIAAHTLATFVGRASNVDTNWELAAGNPPGLLAQPWRGALVDYYALSVFFLAVHLALGLRIVLLSHQIRESSANRVVYAGAAIGVLVTALIMAAVLGLHVGS